MKNVFFVLFLIVIQSDLVAKVFNSSTSGEWNDPVVWDIGELPGEGDTVEIGKGHLVNLTNLQAQVQCMYVYGGINFSHTLARLDIEDLICMDSAVINGSVTGNLSTTNFLVQGHTNLGRVRLEVINQLNVSAPLKIISPTGAVQINQLNIFSHGIWDNQQNRRVRIDGLNNQGSFFAGTGVYELKGEINSNRLLSLAQVHLVGNLVQKDSLAITQSIQSNEFCLLNQGNAVMYLGTTPANVNQSCMEFKDNASLILNRTSSQVIPKITHNYIPNLYLNNQGNVTSPEDVHLQIGNLYIASGSNLQVASPTNFRVDTQSFVLGSITFSHLSKAYLSSIQQKFKFFFGKRGHVQFAIEDTLYLDTVLDFGQIQFIRSSTQDAYVHLTSSSLTVKSDLSLGNRVYLKGNQQKYNIGGNWMGSGVLLDTMATIRVSNTPFSTINLSTIHCLYVDSVDSLRFPFSVTIDSVWLTGSVLDIPMSRIQYLQLDSISKSFFRGSNNTINYVYNQGNLFFTGNNAQNNLDTITNSINGKIFVRNGGNFNLQGGIHNEGEIFGCEGTNCNWHILSDDFYLTGKGLFLSPRVFSSASRITNFNHWEISREARGESIVENYATLNYGANADLIEFTHFGKDSLAIFGFNRIGNQLINLDLFKGIYQLHFFNIGRKSLTNNLFAPLDLKIDHACELYMDTYTISGGTKGQFQLLDSSELIIGKINTLENGGFPNDFAHYQLDTTSIVKYHAMGNQEIFTGCTYGNLELNCGAVQKAIFTLSGDSLSVLGDLNQRKSAIELYLAHQKAYVYGDWYGPGNLNLHNSSFYFGGDGYNYGELKMRNSNFYYVGNKDQRTKTGGYTNLIVEKDFGKRVFTRGNLGVLRIKKLEVRTGILSLATEQTYIEDSLIVWDEVEVSNTIQQKHLHHVLIQAGGKLINPIDEVLFVSGDIINYGNVQVDSAAIQLTGNQHQHIVNHGQMSIADIQADSAAIILEGDLVIKGKLLTPDTLFLQDAQVELLEGASIFCSIDVGDEFSEWYTYATISPNSPYDFYGLGLGISLQTAKKLPHVHIQKKYATADLPITQPLPYFFAIHYPSSTPFLVDLSLSIPSYFATEEVEAYTILKSEDDGMSFFEWQTVVNGAFWLAKDVDTFSWWTAGKDGTSILNLELINFEVNEQELFWEVQHGKDTKGYICRYVNYAMDTFWLGYQEADIQQLVERFYYQGNFTSGYYSLFEVSFDGDTTLIPKSFRHIRFAEEDSTFIRILNGNLLLGDTDKQNVTVYNLEGRMVKNCTTCNQISLTNLNKGMYLVNVEYPTYQQGKLIYWSGNAIH